MRKKEKKIVESGELDTFEVLSNSLKADYEETNAEKYIGFTNTMCPYNLCDGSGYIVKRDGKAYVAQKCKCYEEEIMRRKMRNANISLANGEDILSEDFLIQNEKAIILHPLKDPQPRKIDKRRKTQPDEEPEEYINRKYKQIDLKDNYAKFLKEYVKKSIEYLNGKEPKKVRNLLLIGDFASGVNREVNTIGRLYLLNDKKACATSMKELIEGYIDDKKNIKQKIEKTEFLIIKDLGQEYHTDTGWAVSQIQNLLYTRYENKLPVIATTQFYPNEIEKLYGKKILDLFDATYFIVYVENKSFGFEESEKFLEEFVSIPLDKERE